MDSTVTMVFNEQGLCVGASRDGAQGAMHDGLCCGLIPVHLEVTADGSLPTGYSAATLLVPSRQGRAG
jgi:hypothetical protein